MVSGQWSVASKPKQCPVATEHWPLNTGHWPLRTTYADLQIRGDGHDRWGSQRLHRGFQRRRTQQKIRQRGYFVTRLTEVVSKTKDKKKAKGAKKGKKGKVFVLGGVKTKALVTFTRQFSTLQDAGLPVLRSLRILEGQMKPGRLRLAHRYCR